MKGKEIRQAIREARCVYGSLVVSTSPKWMKYINRSGMDFVFIDTEHASISDETLSWMCYAYGAINLAPVVRIPSPDPYAATKVIDGGASGILAPYIESVEQVTALVGAVKYKPVKGVRLQALLSGQKPLEPELAAYVQRVNENNLLFVNIESLEGMRNLDAILAVPGVDGVIIGPHDLSCSLGIPENYDHPRFCQAVDEILKKASGAGLGAGMHFMGSIDRQIRWRRESGLNICIHSADLNIYVNTLKNDFERMKRETEPFSSPDPG